MGGAGFFQRVYAFLAQVPAGRVVTYGQIASVLGDPRQARVVGWAIEACPEGLPWYRVVNASGGLSTNPRYGNLQQNLLEDEGVCVGPGGRVDLDVYGWPSPQERISP
jgi:methylated-DNA-protein-cysteine methyltransferase-like protein